MSILLEKKNTLPAYVVFLVCSLTLIVYFIKFESRSYRYANSLLSTHADQLFCNKEPVDAAFFGTSRLANAVHAEQIKDVFAENGRENMNIIDFSIGGPSHPAWSEIVGELLEHRKVKLLIIEYSGHQKFFQKNVIYKYHFVPTFKNFIKHLSQYESLSEKLKAISSRINQQEQNLNKTKWEGCDPDRVIKTIDVSLPRAPRPSSLNKANHKIKKTGLRKPENFVGVEVKLEHIFNLINDVIQIANAYEVPIVFVHMPSITQTALPKEHQKLFEEKTNKKLLAWDAGVQDFLREEIYYADETHLDADGTGFIAKWFAEVIKDNIE